MWPTNNGASPTSSGRSLLGHVIGDKYAVTAIIGEGGMGAVYEAEHLQIGRLVAVKVMHPRERTQRREAISRLEHEARVAGRIGHPNICEVYDMGWLPDGSPYLVMERLRGETLAQRIDRCGVVPPNELVDIMLQVLSALVTAHDRGVVHRDLKPENIFLSERAGMLPVAKLLDFGISQASGVDGVMDLTRTGMVMGTPYYMAPEQARGDVELDRRLDLWAAGVILYEALTGQRPFVAGNYNALLVQILTLWHRPVTELDPTIPPGLSRLVDRALAKSRDERFQSAREFQEGLRRFKNQAPVSPQKRRPERVAVRSVVDEQSDDGTMTFARLGEGEEGRDPGGVVVAGARGAQAGARNDPQIASCSNGLQARRGARSPGDSDGGAACGPSESAADLDEGQSRDDESEDRPTIPSLSPIERYEELSEDAEATVVDPPAFPEDMTNVVRGEGRARGGDRG
ncbi:serine/threonine-protein kinase [Sorangium sp. So ce375]|uniref:serine/threonine-protein kinase n=1 Tax=Sorangium sp. So ce375 TaxID=3133306 RepID=UPI003F5C4617